MTVSGVSGPSILSFEEILSWQTLNGLELQPWEINLLRDLSRTYVVYRSEFEDPNSPAPWAKPVTVDREEVADRIRKAFSARVKRPTAKKGAIRGSR
jgi:hypothetical protein